MAINMNAIMGKVEKYAKSAEGKKRMDDKLKEYRESGVAETAAGSKIVSDNDLIKCADEMIKILQGYSTNLPNSVKTHFDGLTKSNIVTGQDGSKIIYIQFGEGHWGTGGAQQGLFRPSLYQDGPAKDGYEIDAPGNYYDGKYGINNIIALFNNGYKPTDGMVYGVWEGHSASGGMVHDDRNFDPSDSGLLDAHVHSLMVRDGLGFIQNAVRDFTRLHGKKYNVIAIPGEDYIAK